MARKNAGKIMILPRGDWDATVAYSTLDLVHIPNAASYLAIKNVPAGTPVSDTNYWQEMSNYEHVIENFILSQDTQPTSEYNRIWLKPSSDDLVLAELADVQEVANDVNDLKSQSSHCTTVLLTTDNWTDNKQTVEIEAIDADETKQIIEPIPANASLQAYTQAGVMAINQYAGQLEFSCNSVPTDNLTVYVVVTEVMA